MHNTILVTKLYVPNPQPHLVMRPRLIEQLNEGRTCNLTLLSAPTGFGKTTLLSQWAADHRVAWVSLDDQDNDPARFFAYLIASLQTLHKGIGKEALSMVKPKQPLQPEGVLVSLINELSHIDEPFVLVLDDYHVLENEAVHRAIAFLIDQMPPSMHLVIATRTDPPLPLARMRVRRNLNEIAASDLRFTPEETQSFFQDMMDIELTPQQITALETTTEGWIAGLQLAALSLQGRDDITGFIDAFTGSHRHIADYLAVEVLEQQPDHIQKFLIQTAVLDRMNADLCDAVTGRDDSHAILAQLERQNLFVVPLDEAGTWYRYHHFFGAFLHDYLDQRDAAEIRALHRLAADWLEANDLPEEAVGHALAADEYEQVIRLLDTTAHVMWGRGELTTLLGWLEELPDEILDARPRLRVYRAWALVTLDELNTSEQPISLHASTRARDYTNDSTPLDDIVLEEADMAEAMQAAVATLRGDFSRAIHHSQEALDQLDEDDRLLRAIIMLNLGFTYRDVKAFGQASTAFEEAATIGLEVDNTYIAQIAMNELGRMRMMEGRFRLALEAYDKALKLTQDDDGLSLPVVCAIHMQMGLIHSEWNEDVMANYHLVEAVRLSKRFYQVDILAHSYLGFAMMRRCQGELDGALNLVGQATRIAKQNALTRRIDLAYAMRARLWVAMGKLEEATDWAWQSGLSIDDEPDLATSFEHLTLARILTAQGQTDDARHLLKRILAAAEKSGSIIAQVKALAGMGLAYQRDGEMEYAVEYLEEALTLAEPERYVYSFIEEGAPMAKLLMRLLEEDRTYSASMEYLRKLLAVFGETKVAKSLQAQPLEDPLSDREMEVLELIASGLSNREIAEELVISVGTAKWHTKNIYRKLNVHSRTQAIAQAREIKLIK